jgi:pyruvate formate lyase activating enzyme
LAHERGIKNVYVSSGYISQAALDMIEPYLDGINVDLKAFTEDFYRDQCQARLEPVKRNVAHIACEADVWIEVTTLLIPGLNDSEGELRAMAEWLAEVNPEMVWHVTAFHPDYEMLDRPATSQRARLGPTRLADRPGCPTSTWATSWMRIGRARIVPAAGTS